MTKLINLLHSIAVEARGGWLIELIKYSAMQHSLVVIWAVSLGVLARAWYRESTGNYLI
jgi:hypothetical protein